jgi:hypothetical protein
VGGGSSPFFSGRKKFKVSIIVYDNKIYNFERRA